VCFDEVIYVGSNIMFYVSIELVFFVVLGDVCFFCGFFFVF
jgi:hypothetical protein